MAISQRDIKLLWGRAASRCAFPECRCHLTQNSETTTNDITIGEQAHIVADKEMGPRGNSLLTSDERDAYSNFILLCPTHHTIIDKSSEDFPVEKLHDLKTSHELWVQRTLSLEFDLNQQAKDLIYTSLIDAAVKYCHLSRWKQWTFGPLDAIPWWPFELSDDFLKFRQKIFSADFPGTLPELERSMKTVSILLYRAVKTFQKHCAIKENCDGTLFYDGVRFYQNLKENTKLYDERCQEFDDWVEECQQLIIDATKAVNWFREIVRRDISS